MPGDQDRKSFYSSKNASPGRKKIYLFFLVLGMLGSIIGLIIYLKDKTLFGVLTVEAF